MEAFLLLIGVLLFQAIYHSDSASLPVGVGYDTMELRKDIYGDTVRNVFGECHVNPWQPITYLPHPYDCDQFFICFSGIWQPFTCSAGLHFSPYSKQCQHPSVAGCKLRGIPEERSVGSPNGRPYERSGSKHSGYKPKSKEGSRTSSKSKHSKEKSKPKGSKEKSKEKSKSKNSKERSKSKGFIGKPRYSTEKSRERYVEESSEYSSEEYERVDYIGECPEDDIIFLPHRRDCRKYFVCFDGLPILKECASGLLFNCKRLKCESPEYAVCA